MTTAEVLDLILTGTGQETWDKISEVIGEMDLDELAELDKQIEIPDDPDEIPANCSSGFEGAFDQDHP